MKQTTKKKRKAPAKRRPKVDVKKAEADTRALIRQRKGLVVMPNAVPEQPRPVEAVCQEMDGYRRWYLGDGLDLRNEVTLGMAAEVSEPRNVPSLWKRAWAAVRRVFA